MHEWVLARLREKGADPISHVRRQLTEELVKASDLVIAMGRNHQAFIREEYGQAFPCLIRSVLASTSRFWICMKRYRIGKLTLSGLAPMCVR
jgi:protein-tyrosine-phosphatase